MPAPATKVEDRIERSTTNREDFLERLASMSPAARLLAARRGEFSRSERTLWARRYPEEVPVVNGEVEWIALSLADLD